MLMFVFHLKKKEIIFPPTHETVFIHRARQSHTYTMEQLHVG